MKEYKWYGHFSDDGKSYYITEPETPRHWYNYFFNDTFVSFTSQVGFGEGLCQDSMGRRIPLISNRNVFVCENGKYFSACGLPMNSGYTDFVCEHSNGYSTISLVKDGIKTSFTIFVPNEGNLEYWAISLTNTGKAKRNVSLIPYVKTDVDGAYRPQAYNTGLGGFLTEKNAVYAFSHTEFEPKKAGMKRNIYGYMSSSEKADGFDSRRNAFIGPYGEEQHPAALEKGLLCQNTDCNSEKCCLVLQNDLTLDAGETKTVYYTVGVAFEENEVVVPDKASFEREFDAMKAKYADVLGGVEIKTPWENYDKLINGWMKYAADLGSRWARVRHNGYRDMTSDTGCFALVNPKLAWERFKRILSFQYDSGYAPRTIIDGAVRDRRFSDNTVWLNMTAITIIKELGDIKLLDEKVRFNNGGEATVYEHLKRSADFLWNFTGLYGLVRIWGGDWNDCVNFAGLKGKGVSAWLSIAWCVANANFAELAEKYGKADDARVARERGKIMAERIEKHAWDGAYYIYARTDDDIVMGSHTCEQGKIFLISQLWAVFAKLENAEKAMDSVEEILEIPLGTRLAYPAYDHHIDYIGDMAEKPAGVQDNGGIYLHPSSWKLAADSILRRADKVEAGLKKILVFDIDYEVKCGEPYALYNSYFAPETGYRYATPGQSWRTAASSWLLKSTIEYVFGLHPEFDGLRIEPCLPLSWKECSIKKVFRGCAYNIEYIRVGKGCEVSRMETDGKEVKCENNVIAPNGKEINVKVYVG